MGSGQNAVSAFRLALETGILSGRSPEESTLAALSQFSGNREGVSSILLWAKRRAVRRGAWWLLNPETRLLVDCSIRLPFRFKSALLLGFLSAFLGRIIRYLLPAYEVLVEGLRVAVAMVKSALSLGCAEAASWMGKPFVLYWGTIITGLRRA